MLRKKTRIKKHTEWRYMHILGLQKTTLLDYPEKLAATIFTGGCNLRCPFCHNKDLVFPSSDSEILSTEYILSFLDKRKSTLQGVCITGGEPTLQNDLVSFIAQVKAIGLCVKLDTNGFSPEVLDNLLNKQLLDYIAVDIKNTKQKYELTTGVYNDLSKLDTTLNILKSCSIPYEFRTTVVKELHTEYDMNIISEWISFSPKYFLQSFIDSGNTIALNLHPHSEDTMHHFLDICKKNHPNTFLRGIE